MGMARPKRTRRQLGEWRLRTANEDGASPGSMTALSLPTRLSYLALAVASPPRPCCRDQPAARSDCQASRECRVQDHFLVTRVTPASLQRLMPLDPTVGNRERLDEEQPGSCAIASFGDQQRLRLAILVDSYDVERQQEAGGLP